ncbi:hypothetical protein MIND_00994100 [Mycena indigotica]|uniref:Uncharacterized protein n=1 Tax=Mycena indigotica TaxID=2126181 RepID=A0A8H6S7Y6_9AGAR|nr:uncharacterized protein MIND_00994100 [Mycena indigotica]KAF7294576.1 hypothetical protein MIND_00994100 [Mycena indigotica]
MFALRFFSIAILAISSFAAPSTPPGQVVTPKGLRDASTVHEIPSGGKVKHVGNSTVHIISNTGSVLKVVKLKPELEAAVPTPTSDAPIPLQTGWVAYAHYFNNDVPIGSFKTTWTVPPTPAANHGQTLFLFNSIEPGSFDGIMQPVLQWGPSAAGGGAQWMLASWYLYPGGTFFTPLVGVSVGQTLQGEVQLVGASGGTFNYLSSFTNVGGTALEVDGGEELKWATLTLEAYGVTTRNDYPAGSTVFSATNLELTNGGFPNINWATVSDTADGIITTVNTEGSTAAVVTITY